MSKKQLKVGCKTTWLKNMDNFFFDHPTFVNDEITRQDLKTLSRYAVSYVIADVAKKEMRRNICLRMKVAN